jgi:hypothetical protein
VLQLFYILDRQNDDLTITGEHAKRIILELLTQVSTLRILIFVLPDFLITPVYHRLCLWVEDEPVKEVWQAGTVSDYWDMLEARIGFLAQKIERQEAPQDKPYC